MKKTVENLRLRDADDVTRALTSAGFKDVTLTMAKDLSDTETPNPNLSVFLATDRIIRRYGLEIPMSYAVYGLGNRGYVIGWPQFRGLTDESPAASVLSAINNCLGRLRCALTNPRDAGLYVGKNNRKFEENFYQAAKS